MEIENREPIRPIREEDFAKILEEAQKTEADKVVADGIRSRSGEDQLTFGIDLIDLGLGLVVSKEIKNFDQENREIIIDKLIEVFHNLRKD